MKKRLVVAGVLMLLISAVMVLDGGRAAWAEQGNFLFSSISNNTWALDRSSRQLILINFDKPDKVWKSQPVRVPENFDLDRCELNAVGIRGTAAFLVDTAAGLVTFYDAKDDGTVKMFQVVDVKAALK